MDLTAEIAYLENLGERRGRSNIRAISFIFNEFIMPWWRETILSQGFGLARRVNPYPIGGHKWEVRRLQSGEGYIFSIDDLPPEAYASLPGIKRIDFACSLEFVFQENPGELPFSSSGMVSPRAGARRVNGKIVGFALPGEYRIGVKVIRRFYEGGPGSPQNMGWQKEWIEAFSPELKSTFAHEYQHLVDIVAGGIIGGKEEYSIQAQLGKSLEAYFRYRNLPSEVRATARELAAEASKRKLPVVQVLDTMLTRLTRGLDRRFIEKAFEQTPGAFPALEQQLRAQLETDIAALRQVYVAELERRYPRLRGELAKEGGNVPLEGKEKFG